MPSYEETRLIMGARMLGGALREAAAQLCICMTAEDAKRFLEITIEKVITTGVELNIEIPEEPLEGVDDAVKDLLDSLGDPDKDEEGGS